MSINMQHDYDADMKLPEGATCDGCVHASRCFAFGYSKPGRTSCDFHPNKYVPKQKASALLD